MRRVQAVLRPLRHAHPPHEAAHGPQALHLQALWTGLLQVRPDKGGGVTLLSFANTNDAKYSEKNSINAVLSLRPGLTT